MVRASSAAPVNTEGGGVLEHELRHARRPVLEAHAKRRQHLRCIWAGSDVTMADAAASTTLPVPLLDRGGTSSRSWSQSASSSLGSASGLALPSMAPRRTC